MIVLFTYFWSSDPLSHPYSQALTLTPHSHLHISDNVIPLSHYTSSLYHTHTTIITHLLSHITQHNTSQLTHHHINTMTTSHSPADDGRNNSSESSCYAYIYCNFYVFTQLYKSLKYRSPLPTQSKFLVFGKFHLF